MGALYGRRAALLGAVISAALLLGCDLILGFHEVSPLPPDGLSVTGTFVGSAAQGSKSGVELRGQLLWHASTRGTKDGVTLEGSLH